MILHNDALGLVKSPDNLPGFANKCRPSRRWLFFGLLTARKIQVNVGIGLAELVASRTLVSAAVRGARLLKMPKCAFKMLQLLHLDDKVGLVQVTANFVQRQLNT